MGLASAKDSASHSGEEGKSLALLEARRVESEIERNEAEAKRIQVETFPLSSWPKILVSIALALLGGGSAALGITEARTVSLGWSASLVQVIILAGFLYAFAGSLLYYAIREVSLNEKAKLLRYMILFSEKPPTPEVANVERSLTIGLLGLSVSAASRVSRPEEAATPRPREARSAKRASPTRSPYPELIVGFIVALVAAGVLSLTLFRDTLTTLTIVASLGSGLASLFFLFLTAGEQRVKSKAADEALRISTLQSEFERLRETIGLNPGDSGTRTRADSTGETGLTKPKQD